MYCTSLQVAGRSAKPGAIAPSLSAMRHNRTLAELRRAVNKCTQKFHMQFRCTWGHIPPVFQVVAIARRAQGVESGASLTLGSTSTNHSSAKMQLPTQDGLNFSSEKFVADGCVIIEGLLDAAFIKDAKRELSAAIDVETRMHAGENYRDYAMVLLCSLYGGPFLDLFDNARLMHPFNAVLGPGCIVYAYTSSSMPPGRSNYSRRVHVDCPRLIPGYVTNLGATILLDDFTEENGATWYLPGSHLMAEAPTDEDFYRRAKRVIAPAGSVFFFNARTWHAGGENRTEHWRHALTINMCRPYMKQRIDVPRAMSHLDLSGTSETVLQKLGFLAQVPANYDEYYLPADQRKYRQPTE